MTSQSVSSRSPGIRVAGLFAAAFGLLTILMGGSVLFVDGSARQAAGHYVPFVLWFNFIAGFAYLITGLGLCWRRRWAAWLAVIIALSTVIVFISLGLFIISGFIVNDVEYETRTIIAMTVRSAIWIIIAAYAGRAILPDEQLLDLEVD